LSDRQEIQDLMVAYCYAIDRKNWDDLDQVFTPDAIIDYTEMVGFRGNLAETKAFLVQGLAQLAAYQHSISPARFALKATTAHGRTLCSNPMVIEVNGTKQTMFVVCGIATAFVRTAKDGAFKNGTKNAVTPTTFAGLAAGMNAAAAAPAPVALTSRAEELTLEQLNAVIHTRYPGRIDRELRTPRQPPVWRANGFPRRARDSEAALCRRCAAGFAGRGSSASWHSAPIR